MKKLIFRKILTDIVKFFLIVSLSLGLIVWVIQAVNFLDFVSEDGHSFRVYFLYTLLNLPKILSRILPFVFFLSVFYIINKYENNNELLIFWNFGVTREKFINTFFKFSLFFLIFQLLMTSVIVPFTQDKARSYIRNSNIDYFPSLVKEKMFIDTVTNLTIFVEKKNELEEYENIFLKDKINDNSSQIIYAKKGKFKSDGGANVLVLYDGEFLNRDGDKFNKFSFKTTEFNLSKYTTKTTTFPKIQEIKTNLLFSCINSLDNEKKFSHRYLECNDKTVKTIKQEFLKRIYMPIYIPLLGLICCFQILISKNDYNYSKKKLSIFLYASSILILSEISLRYANEMNYYIILLIPIFLFFLNYIIMIKKTKLIKNN